MLRHGTRSGPENTRCTDCSRRWESYGYPEAWLTVAHELHAETAKAPTGV